MLNQRKEEMLRKKETEENLENLVKGIQRKINPKVIKGTKGVKEVKENLLKGKQRKINPTVVKGAMEVKEKVVKGC